MHVSLHSNASAAGQARGAEIYTHRFGGEGERLARDIYQYLSALTPTEDLGVKEGYQTFNGQGMYELRRTVAPAILAEVAFHDNPADAQFIIDNIYELGREISKGFYSILASLIRRIPQKIQRCFNTNITGLISLQFARHIAKFERFS